MSRSGYYRNIRQQYNVFRSHGSLVLFLYFYKLYVEISPNGSNYLINSQQLPLTLSLTFENYYKVLWCSRPWYTERSICINDPKVKCRIDFLRSSPSHSSQIETIFDSSYTEFPLSFSGSQNERTKCTCFWFLAYKYYQ